MIWVLDGERGEGIARQGISCPFVRFVIQYEFGTEELIEKPSRMGAIGRCRRKHSRKIDYVQPVIVPDVTLYICDS